MPPSFSRRIIGIDPGLRTTGWGVIVSEGTRLTHVAHGVCRSPEKDSLSERLKSLYVQLKEVVAHWEPAEAAVEESFVHRNAQAALKLGHARAIALLVPTLFDVPVSAYAPNTIKKAVVGAGHATKDQVFYMMKIFFPPLAHGRKEVLDAMDALAIAVCHAQHPAPHMVLSAR